MAAGENAARQVRSLGGTRVSTRAEIDRPVKLSPGEARVVAPGWCWRLTLLCQCQLLTVSTLLQSEACLTYMFVRVKDKERGSGCEDDLFFLDT